MSGSAQLSIARLRRRLPFIVFLLLLVFLVGLLGMVCMCMTDHPSQAADRAIAAVVHAPALIEMWSFTVTFTIFLAVGAELIRGTGRASPARLQRFLF